MADESIFAVVQEIRDLQKQQLEQLRGSIANQQQALANQQQSLSVQQQAVERQKALAKRSSQTWIFVLVAIFFLYFVQFIPFFFRLFFGHLWYR